MAIDYTGKVTTTGLMNQGGTNVQVPNMSNLTPKEPVQTRQQPEQKKEVTEKKSNAITDEDMAVLKPVLSPSVIEVLRKLVPKFGPFLAQAGTGEENFILPRSVVVNYAMRNYGGNNEDEAMNSFITDLSNTQMDNINVPLDSTTDQASSGMMAKNEPQLPEQDDSGVDVSQDLV